MNKMKHKMLAASLLLLAQGGAALAQGTVEDYNRAYDMANRYNRSLVVNLSPSARWVGQGHSYTYRIAQGDDTHYRLAHADKGGESTLFTASSIAAKLGEALGRTVGVQETAALQTGLSATLDTVRFDFERRRWFYLPASGELGLLPAQEERRGRGGWGRYWSENDEERGSRPVLSPDGSYAVFVRDNNVVLSNRQSGEERTLSSDGKALDYYSDRLQWSPDGRWVAAIKISAPAEKRYIYYVESSPKEQLQPRLHKQEYAKPGDSLPQRTPILFEVESGRQVVPSDELFAEQYSLGYLAWNDDSRAVTFEYNRRGHQVYRVLEMALDGSVRPLVEEKRETFVNYNRRFRHDLENGREMIWMSERDNWNHLYLVDRATGSLRQITQGEWYVRQVLQVDEKNRCIYFTANGRTASPDEDPYLVRYYRIGFNGKGLVCLTPATGHHTATFSDDKRYLIDTYSQVDAAPVTELRDARNGKLLRTIARADAAPLEAAGWHAPQPFCAKGRDGVTDIWGIIVRPSNFDPAKKYPVVEYIYAGPGDHYVPKSFSPFLYNMTDLAELGFIVVQIDGMGTSYRSKAFEDVCFKNLKDAGFPDRKLWIKAAAEKYPAMDTTRVGIFGASAGGQEAMAAVLFHPEFYKAAYSSCGCHDNRMDKIWWNEQWMSYPIGEQYKECSNVENAHLLTRPLMLVVGEIDSNVDPSSTYQVVDALIKANKSFELVMLPGVNHTMGEAYGQHKRFDFFVKNLLGVEPPAWESLKKR